MKTVGQILRSGRLKKDITISRLSALTKIDSRYIEALEADRYEDLPSDTFAKGFIRNLASRLDLNPNELVAIFRRDYKQPAQVRTEKPRRRAPLIHTSSQFVPFVIGGMVFVIYLIFQFRVILTPPKLIINKPSPGSVLVSPLEIEGETSLDSVVYINEETQVKPASNGSFFARINLPVGENTLEIKAVNRFSRFSSEKIAITIISK